jgi:hypothetical protein
MRPPKLAKTAKTSKNQRLENTPLKLQNQLVEFELIRRPAADVHIYGGIYQVLLVGEFRQRVYPVSVSAAYGSGDIENQELENRQNHQNAGPDLGRVSSWFSPVFVDQQKPGLVFAGFRR